MTATIDRTRRKIDRGSHPVIVSLALAFLSVSVSTQGATYYVAKIGKDTYTCTQALSPATPRATIRGGLSCLSPGDSLIISAGTYTEGIEHDAIPSGVSESAPTIVKAAPSAQVIVDGVNSTGDVVTIDGRQFVTLDGLIIDGRNKTGDRPIVRIGGSNPYSHFVTIQNGIVRNSTDNSCITNQGPGGANSHLRFVNLEVYGCGADQWDHGIYLTGRNSRIENNIIHHNRFGHGIHHYSGSEGVNDNVIRNNTIYANGSYGIGVYSGSRTIVYNNILHGNGSFTGQGGLRAGSDSVDTKIYNNTIYNNSGYAIFVTSGSAGTRVYNNLGWRNSSDLVFNQGSTTSISHNIFGDPSFTNPASADFVLSEGSIAIDAGIALTEVATDFRGVSRPQGRTFDVGASEYVAGEAPGPPTNVRVTE